MSEDDFRDLFRILAESYVIAPEAAKQLLRRILRILAESSGEERQ